MGELGALFNPGMRHELEERRAKAARREEEGNARDGDLRIDLDSGVAVISTPGEDGDSAAASDTRERAAGGSAGAGAATLDSDSDSAVDEPPVAGAAATERADEAAGPSAPAPLRPRGKRGMAAGRR